MAANPEATQTSTTSTREPVIKSDRAKRLFLIFGGLVVLLLVIYGVFELLTYGKESTDDAQISADVVPVAPRVPGQVLNVPIAENQLVHKGDLIAEIDPHDLQAKLTQAQGDLLTAEAQAAQADAQAQVAEAAAHGGLAQAQAAVAGSKESVDASTDAIGEAHAGLARAEANARKAKLDYDRAKELVAKGDIPRAQADAMRASAETADADVASARAHLQSAEDAKQRALAGVQQAQGQLQQSSPVGAQIAAVTALAKLAHAKVQTMQAALETAQLNLSYTKIYAPITGYAAKLGVHAGQLISVGQPICQLVPVNSYVVANFKETQVREMKTGQKVKISIDTLGGKEYEGSVQSISGGTGASFSMLPADNASGNFVKVVQRIPVRIEWKGPSTVEAPVGSSADVTVYTH